MATKTIRPLPARPTLAQYLAYHIVRSGLTNREIGAACGFARPNMVSMIKKGHSRLPLERLGAMAEVLEIDTQDLFFRWMDAYYRDTWQRLKSRLT